jgi:hypothetical protein
LPAVRGSSPARTVHGAEDCLRKRLATAVAFEFERGRIIGFAAGAASGDARIVDQTAAEDL